jgi:glycosyltransferase involved in cell wall biosynthesis
VTRQVLSRPSAPYRVVLVEGNRDGTVGGSFQCLHDIARHLSPSRFEPVAVFWDENRFADQLRRAGVEVHVWSARCPRERGPARRRSLPARGARLIRAILARRAFLRAVRASIVHLNNSPEVGYDDWLPAARLLGLPIIAHARAEARGGLGRVARRLAGSFDRVIAISRHVAATLPRAGVPVHRVAQIYDGIDLSAVREAAQASSEVRALLRVPPDAFLVLMAGNLKRWKGQHVLLEAVGLLPPGKRERVRVMFAGAAPLMEEPYAVELHELAARLGLTAQVHWLGTRGDVPALMAASDVVVHASIQPEPLGLVVVEAMALGTPVVASKLGGPAETITPGAGLLIDPARPAELAQALQTLLEDASLRRSLAERGRVRAEAFSIQQNVAAIEQEYAKVLQLPAPEPHPV